MRRSLAEERDCGTEDDEECGFHPTPPTPRPASDDHHAFHEDAKPGDLTGQVGTEPLAPRRSW